ncbi:DNA repair protein RecO [Yoonia sediminilitoris]|uniref:DNA repair protein RecO n=1 Tax=Yoonia sediminilitoris TaxID=1286148 RepID=A0A2T6KH10_9RHOB|nr:DNA repair protein RecO [Yoonia sediminilitoris]PUB14806.1 DNA replication and repair protein RecO [Yoonia sediminilitoris]RCW95523.1 DNA replication and repair protein RecO [Yoonia sediminilitoris]
MIDWTDEGAILASRPFGETSVIIEVFCAQHGRHAGVVRGGNSRKRSPALQPGAQVSLTWKARLESHLGTFAVEPLRSRTAVAMRDRLSLAGLNAVCAILAHVLPEREAHVPLYQRTISLLDLLGQGDVWPLAYLRWEQALLDEMGFGMDLSRCAVRGVNQDLIYVSPKSGRAVSREAAGEWVERMLPLPPVLAGKGDANTADILTALKTTGYFIEHRLMRSLGDRPMPAARGRLLDAISRAGDAQ